jgi:predicted O-methyltransferase YrrM
MRVQHESKNTELIRGFTDDTLEPGTGADFVFIDGDHRTDAIWRDFRKIRDNSKLICFDDVVFDGPENAGAKPIMDHLAVQEGWETRIVPFAIPFKPQGICSIGFAWQKGTVDSMVLDIIDYWAETVEAATHAG